MHHETLGRVFLSEASVAGKCRVMNSAQPRARAVDSRRVLASSSMLFI